MTPRGDVVAAKLATALRESAYDAVTTLTDDGGLVIELSSHDRRRDLLFAIPDDGSAIYFTARDLGVRKSGIADDSAVKYLLAWLGDPNYPVTPEIRR